MRRSPLPLFFWRSVNGREPVREWLKTLSAEDKRIVGRDLAKVQFGWPIGMPLCRPLRDGCFEVRSSLPSRREARVILCHRDDCLIALHAFLKRTRTTPHEEIALALQRMRGIR